MKRLDLLMVGLLIIGLMTSCGGGSKENSKSSKVETASIEKMGYRVSISYPIGFFTRSEEKDDRVFPDSDGSTFIGKDFTLQVYAQNHLYPDFEKCKAAAVSQRTYVADITGDGIEGFYRRPFSGIHIMCIFNIEDGGKNAAYVSLIPNEYKKLTLEELNDDSRKKEYVDRCNSIMQSKEMQDIIKSVKVVSLK
jgi:hypothetical protein